MSAPNGLDGDNPAGTGLARAVSEWQRAVGEEHVLTDAVATARAEIATFAASSRVLAIVRPGSREEVQECLRIATRHGAPISPVSTGKNWGFGSRLPARDAVLLDLGRMKRIVAFDEDLAVMTVEPGVTFRQAYDFLCEKRAKVFLNGIGGSPDASVLANAIERGDGAGPHADRFAHVAGLEVVLATGEHVRTGFGRFDGTALGPLHRHGVGPSLAGLFSQSNLGVVTSLSIWLAKIPRTLTVVRFSIGEGAGLSDAVDALRTLRLDGTLRGSAGLWNRARVESAGGSTPDGAWFGSFALYGASADQGAADAAHVRNVLAPVVDEISTDTKTGDAHAGAELFAPSDPALAFLQGVPHTESLRSTYFAKKGPAPAHPDPDRDRCGVLWMCPVAALRGADVARAAAIADQVMRAHRFAPLLAIVVVADRTATLLPMLTYDRDTAGADEGAMRCHDELLEKLAAEGFLPGRLGVQSMGALPKAVDDSAAFFERLKSAVDPADVLARGRYDFRAK